MTMRRRTTSILLSGLGGGLLAVVGVCVVLGFTSPEPLPSLTRESFDAAWAKWEEKGPISYDVGVNVTGRQAATYRVQVRHRNVSAATRNGYPLKSQRTLGTWSVPGMFNTIEIDLDRNEEVPTDGNPSAKPRLVLGCTFDAQYGYPKKYRRNELGTQMQVDWEVTEFRVVKGE